MPEKRCHNEKFEFEDREHEALMGVWWAGILLKKNARRFFSNYLSSEVQFNIMIVLKYATGPMSQNEISEQLLVDKSNITGLIDRMEKASLLVRKQAPHDRRAYHIELTAAGREIIEKLEQPYHEHVKQLMSVFSADEVTKLTEFMERLQSSMNNHETMVLDR